MNKKILFGSIFVLSLILLMPSITAIEQKTVKEDRFPLLKEILWLMGVFRHYRGEIILGNFLIPPTADNLFLSLLFLRGLWLYYTGEFLLENIEF